MKAGGNHLFMKRWRATPLYFAARAIPKLPDNVIHNQSTIYYRFHGVPILYASQYEKKKLQLIIDQVQMSDPLKQVYIYFNNTIGMAGIRNARQTVQLVKSM